MEEAGIGGPIFVSIGDAEKLNAFLDVNPFIPKDQMFVDDYSFDAYKAAGFGRFDEVDSEAVKNMNIKMTAPELGFGEWINYFTTVGKVTPMPKDAKFGDFPEGVVWVGGTFVIQGKEVLYQWSDTVPGNHPVVGDVVKVAKDAKDAASNKKENNSFGNIGWF